MHRERFSFSNRQHALMALLDSRLWIPWVAKGSQSSQGWYDCTKKALRTQFFSLSPSSSRWMPCSKAVNSCHNAGVGSKQNYLGGEKKKAKSSLFPVHKSQTQLASADTHLPLYLALLVSLDLLPEGWVKEQRGSTVVNKA